MNLQSNPHIIGVTSPGVSLLTGCVVDRRQHPSDANEERVTEHDPRSQYDTYAVQTRVAARRVASIDDPWNVLVEGEGAQSLPGGACF